MLPPGYSGQHEWSSGRSGCAATENSTVRISNLDTIRLLVSGLSGDDETHWFAIDNGLDPVREDSET